MAEKRRLVLLTLNYPFGEGESFLETELAYLSQDFSVEIIPCVPGPELGTRPTGDPAPLPCTATVPGGTDAGGPTFVAARPVIVAVRPAMTGACGRPMSGPSEAKKPPTRPQ